MQLFILKFVSVLNYPTNTGRHRSTETRTDRLFRINHCQLVLDQKQHTKQHYRKSGNVHGHQNTFFLPIALKRSLLLESDVIRGACFAALLVHKKFELSTNILFH